MFAACDVPAASEDLTALDVCGEAVHLTKTTCTLYARWGFGALRQSKRHIAVEAKRVIVPVDSGVVAVLGEALIPVSQVAVADDVRFYTKVDLVAGEYLFRNDIAPEHKLKMMVVDASG